jgi:CMP-N,N'-diacetyllegionaminic acid synthase
MKKVLCVIGARGGSKGVPRKNIRNLLGKPLITWSIEQAFASKYIDRVIVSTDCHEIAEIAVASGASVPFSRPFELSTSEVGKFSVFKHALSMCSQIYQEEFEVYLDLDCTSPLRSISDIDNSLELFEKAKALGADGVFSICEARKNPYFNLVETDADGFLDFSKKCSPPIIRRQDAPKVYEHVASIYALDPAYVLSSSNLLDGKLIGYDIGQDKSLDIDSEFDFKLVEYLMSQKSHE